MIEIFSFIGVMIEVFFGERVVSFLRKEGNGIKKVYLR